MLELQFARGVFMAILGLRLVSNVIYYAKATFSFLIKHDYTKGFTFVWENISDCINYITRLKTSSTAVTTEVKEGDETPAEITVGSQSTIISVDGTVEQN